MAFCHRHRKRVAIALWFDIAAMKDRPLCGGCALRAKQAGHRLTRLTPPGIVGRAPA